VCWIGIVVLGVGIGRVMATVIWNLWVGP